MLARVFHVPPVMACRAHFHAKLLNQSGMFGGFSVGITTSIILPTASTARPLVASMFR